MVDDQLTEGVCRFVVQAEQKLHDSLAAWDSLSEQEKKEQIESAMFALDRAGSKIDDNE